MTVFKERIKELMSIYNLSQADICKKAGIPKSSLSMYLDGSRVPKQDKIMSIANAYGVSPAWLNGFDVPMIDNPVFSAESAILDAKISNDMVLKEAIKKYYELSDSDRAEVIEFINYKYQKGH